MQFNLPHNLQQELIAYDPVLKSLARQNKPTTPTKKAKHPLGKPKCLIPTDVVRETLQNDAVDNINTLGADRRYRAFTRVSNVATPEASVSIYAFIYHYEQCWYAAWLPPKGKEDEYIYGYAYAFKDTTTARGMLPYTIKNHLDECTVETIGRTTWYSRQELVTKQDIIDGKTSSNWVIPNIGSYYQKSKYICEDVIRPFEKQLPTTIPIWTDSRNIFDRIKTTSSAEVVFDSRVSNSDCKEYWKTHDIKTTKLSYELIFDIIQYYAHDSSYSGMEYRDYNKILHIIATPFFKKWIQNKCDEVNQNFYDVNCESVTDIRRPYKQIHKLLIQICRVNELFGDVPIDYYQTHMDVLMSVEWPAHGTLLTQQWLKAHMPVASFFHIFSKYYETCMAEVSHRAYRFNNDTGLYRFHFSDWRDTIQMLDTILAHNVCATEPVELVPPKRWRLSEFHDHVQAQAWKIKNKNESLPQDLFPVPVKVQLQETNWTFFQPIDTHQLGSWGQAVRNCVGNASGYADGVRKKKHFIVLCMLNNKPQFTIQLEVNMGMMTVKQIAGINNSRLTEEQRELYTTAFSQALNQRESALVSA
jgi:hypothetical protein